MDKYLASTEFIDWQTGTVSSQAAALADGLASTEQVARHCFEFVRDQIKQSSDYRLNPVTCKASDVLEHRTGFCYAKSYLLAALGRANGIPAGLCYQRLTISDRPPFSLYGLNAVNLSWHG
ncbi:MAG: transglutaminase family protein [Immundisolibacteraceae bacterium]|nr:transglutaminase family protein [Immundisolibacteraceae bacterium]